MKRANRIISALCAGILVLSGSLGFMSVPARGDADNPGMDLTQYNVTVPLYVTMYAYAGDGSVVTPEGEAYSIRNYSACDVIISKIQGIEASGRTAFRFVPSASSLNAQEIFMTLNGVTLSAKEITTRGTSDTGGDWFIGEGTADRPTVFPIDISAQIAGLNVNSTGLQRVCWVRYTLRILPVWYHITYYNNNGLTVLNDGTRVESLVGREPYTATVTDADGKTVLDEDGKPVTETRYNYYVTDDDIHGVAPADEYVHKGDPYIAPEMAADGWVFTGWSMNSAAEQASTGNHRVFLPGQADSVTPGILYDSDGDGESDSLRLYAEWERDLDKLVYLSADYLENVEDKVTIDPNYNIYDQNNGFDVTLYNYEKYNGDKVSTLATDQYNNTGTKTMSYRITATAYDKSNNVISGGVTGFTVGDTDYGSTDTVKDMPVSGARASQNAHFDLNDEAKAQGSYVRVRAELISPMDGETVLKTLEGKFTMAGLVQPTISNVRDNGDGTVSVFVSSNNYRGDYIPVEWSTAKLQPDNTNAKMSNWTNGDGTTSSGRIESFTQNTTYELIFFKTTDNITDSDISLG